MSSDLFGEPYVPTKRCPKCGKTKPLDDFHLMRRHDSRTRRQSYCRTCTTAGRKAWIAAQGPNRRRQLSLQRYGITLEQYEAMLASQGGVCAICKQPQTAKTSRGTKGVRRMDVDHCHDSGLVRGLLCIRCNRGLGAFRDNPDLLRAAIAYLANSGVA